MQSRQCFVTDSPAFLPMQDLLLAANDQPFRFPAAFTFVVGAALQPCIPHLSPMCHTLPKQALK